MPSDEASTIFGYSERSQKQGFRELAELGVVRHQLASLEAGGQTLFHHLRSRGRDNSRSD